MSLCAPASTVIIWLKNKQLPAQILHGSGAMATFTAEQFGELVASMVALSQALSANAQIAAATTSGGGADRRDRGSRKLSVKTFNRVNKFAQGEAQWKEFHFDFGVLIGAEYLPLLDTLKVVEQMTDETDTPMVRALDGEHADRLDLEKVSKELYEVLVTITEGEANLMVKNVINNDGVLAYHRLYRHYNRRTLARVLRMTREALHPKAVHDLKQLISKVVEWEDKLARMAAEHKETLPVI